jgi:ketosteroid isomerase-like protein
VIRTEPHDDGLSDIERVIARDEIRQLAYRYAYAVDARDIELLLSLFVPDVRVTQESSGHEAMRKFWIESLRATGVSILFVGNHIIDFDHPERARGIVYCRAQVQDGERWIEQAIQYRDTYDKRDGRWLFVKRTHVLWYGVETAERPLDQPPANWPERQEGRGTVPEDIPSWHAFWDSLGPGPDGRTGGTSGS